MGELLVTVLYLFSAEMVLPTQRVSAPYLSWRATALGKGRYHLVKRSYLGTVLSCLPGLARSNGFRFATLRSYRPTGDRQACSLPA